MNQSFRNKQLSNSEICKRKIELARARDNREDEIFWMRELQKEEHKKKKGRRND